MSAPIFGQSVGASVRLKIHSAMITPGGIISRKVKTPLITSGVYFLLSDEDIFF